jgi:hypothetical protein
MKFIISTALIAVTLLLCACDKNNASQKDVAALDRKSVEYKNNVDAEAAGDNTGFLGMTDSTGTQSPGINKQAPPRQDPPANPDWDKKIIKNASLNLEVKDYNVYYNQLREKVKSVGGYIAQEEQSLSDYKKENSLTIKVPVDQFDNAVASISADVVKINEKKISSQDVTAEFVDTRSRMEAKRQVRQRYMDLLKQAKNMEEILNVQGEINSIQEDIEAAAGRIEYLGHSSAFSTINLTYYQVLNATAKTSDATPSFGSKLGSAFKSGGNWVLELVLGLITIWPLFLFVFILFIAYKKIKTQKVKV